MEGNRTKGIYVTENDLQCSDYEEEECKKKGKFVPKILKNNSIKYSYIEQKYEQHLVLVHSKFDLKNTD